MPPPLAVRSRKAARCLANLANFSSELRDMVAAADRSPTPSSQPRPAPPAIPDPPFTRPSSGDAPPPAAASLVYTMAGLLFPPHDLPPPPPPCLRDLAHLAWSLLRSWEEGDEGGLPTEILEPPLEEVWECVRATLPPVTVLSRHGLTLLAGSHTLPPLPPPDLDLQDVSVILPCCPRLPFRSSCSLPRWSAHSPASWTPRQPRCTTM